MRRVITCAVGIILCALAFAQSPERAVAQAQPSSNPCRSLFPFGFTWNCLPSGAIPSPTLTPTPAPVPTATPNSAFAISSPPVITPEPTTPTTMQLRLSDSVVDALGLDTNITQSSNFTAQAAVICNNWYGKFECFRHIRDGLVVGNGNNDASLNYLATNYGVKLFQIVNSGDTNSAVTTGLARHSGLERVGPINEPNLDTMLLRLSAASTSAGAQNNIAISSSSTYPYTGTHVLIGEGPTQEAGQIAAYNSASSMNLAVATTQTHVGGFATTLSSAIVAGNPQPTSAPYGGPVPPSPVGSPPVVATPLPAFPPSPVPSGAATSIPLANVNGLQPNQWLTLGCYGVNAGSFTNTEYVQVASSYTPVAVNTPGAVPITTTPLYTHATFEPVVTGCVMRAPDNVFGAINDSTLEVARVAGLVTPIQTYTVAYAFANTGAANLPFYGGVPFNYSTFNRTQIHGYCSGNCGGSYGDGASGFGGTHQGCFGQNIATASNQYNICSGWSIGGNQKPIDCTECGWPMVPDGSPYGNSPGATTQIPDAVGVDWQREPLYQISHGFASVYTFQGFDGPTGFCTYGLFRTSSCTGFNGGVSTPTPKPEYYALTDIIGFLVDDNCKYPYCTFTPDSITWNWSSLPAVSRTYCHYTNAAGTSISLSQYCGTDPGQVRSIETEKSDGSVRIVYWNEATDYYQSLAAVSGTTGYPCTSTTSCIQYCGNTSNSSGSSNDYNCWSTTIHIVGAHNWTCTNNDVDDYAADSTYGHLLPTGSLVFNSSDLATVNVRAEYQAISCTGTGFSPTTHGTPPPSPTPAPVIVNTPQPMPSYPAPTAVPPFPGTSATPIYSDYTPGPTYPVAVTLPTPAAFTVMAQVACPSTANSSGVGPASTIMSLTDSWDLDAGLCNSTTGTPVTNSGDAFGPHMYVQGGNSQSAPANQLIGTTTASPYIYTVFATYDGTNVTWTQCTYPTIVCTSAAPVAATLSYDTSSGSIGGSSAGSRIMPSAGYNGGYIWNVNMWPTAFNSRQIAAYATNLSTVNPYPSPTPTPAAIPSPIYTDAVPATPYPVTIPSLPITSNLTVVVAINCLQTNTTGAGIFGAASTFSSGSGLCNSAAADPTSGTGAHIYDQYNSLAHSTTLQTQFTTPNAPSGITVGNGLALGQYVVAFSNDGTTLNAFVCPLPYTANNCVENQTSDAYSFSAGNVVGYIGSSNDGTSRVANGLLDIWNVAEYPSALTLANINTLAAAVPADPYPTPPPSAVGGYPSPMPAWPNALAAAAYFATPVPVSYRKSYSTAGATYYAGQGTGTGYTPVSGGVPGWDYAGNYEVYQTAAISGGTGLGGLALAKTTDPKWTLVLSNSSSTSKCILYGSYNSCGYAATYGNITNVYIPNGTIEEGAGGSCDCHLQLIEPSGWTPQQTGITWPDVSPNQYELDIFQGASSSATSSTCPNGSNQMTVACGTFTSSSNNTMYAGGLQIVSTGSYGWGDGTGNANNWFAPANSPPVTKTAGSSYAGAYGFSSLAVTGYDIMQGSINHETGVYLGCAGNTSSDVWPGVYYASDQTCPGGNQWNYKDHILLNRTDAQINQDAINCSQTSYCGSAGKLNQFQVMLARNWEHYGAQGVDTIWYTSGGALQENGAAFNLVTSSGGPDWALVAAAYPSTVVSLGSAKGVLIDIGLPMAYIKAYAGVYSSCIFGSTTGLDLPFAPSSCS